MVSGQSYHEARNALPEELRGPFDDLIEDYKFNVMKIHGSRMYAPKVLAELIKAGWRLVEEARQDSSGSKAEQTDK